MASFFCHDVYVSQALTRSHQLAGGRFLLCADKLQPCCAYRQWPTADHLPIVCVYDLHVVCMIRESGLHPGNLEATETLGLSPGTFYSSGPGTFMSSCSGMISILPTPGNILRQPVACGCLPDLRPSILGPQCLARKDPGAWGNETVDLRSLYVGCRGSR